MTMPNLPSRRDDSSEALRGGPSVWVIDDNAEFSRAFASYIESVASRHTTAAFSSVESAIAKLKEGAGSPDVVLLDVEMPGTNGLDGIVPLKQVAPNCRIYMLTGMDSAWHRSVAAQRGASGYFLKPEISKENLLQILNYR